MADDGNVVRRITISATSEGVDEVTSKVLALGVAVDALTESQDASIKHAADYNKAYADQTDGLNQAAESHHRFYGALKSVTEGVIEGTAVYYAHSAALNAAAYALKTVMGVAFEFYVAYKAVSEVVTLGAEAWRLGGEQIQKYAEIGKNAGDVSVEFYQRATIAAKEAKIPVEDLTKAFNNLNNATSERLGGSDANRRLSDLLEAGNFKGNTGVSAFKSAISEDDKMRAGVDLFNQAVQAGQRLAALDFAKTIWGAEAARNLAKNQDYMRNILESADAISSKQLVSQADIDHAVMLQNKYEAAVAILEQRWHPIQDVLTNLGVKMREVWIDIVSSIAGAVDAVFKLAQALTDKIPPGFWTLLQSGTNLGSRLAAGAGAAFGPFGAPFALAGTAGTLLTNDSGGSQSPMDAARANLASQLGNPANVAQAQYDSVMTSFRVRGDTSKDTKKDFGDTSDAIDRATESLQRYVKTTNAAAQSVGLTSGEIERLKATALLEAAAEKEGISLTDARTKGFADLARRAGEAAQALAKAKIANDIQYSRQTALLSPEDVQIASQLKSIYPDVATALNSVEAHAIRTNNVLADMNNTGRQVAEGIGSDLLQQVRAGASAWDAFKTAGINALDKISDKLMQMAVDNLWSKAFGGTGGFGLSNLFGGGSSGSGSTMTMSGTGLGAGTGGLSFPMFASGTDSAPGGWSIVGEKGPELMNVPKGAQILPNGVSPGGGTTVSVGSYSPVYNVQGSGPEIAALKQQMAQDRAEFESRTIAAVRKAKAGRNL